MKAVFIRVLILVLVALAFYTYIGHIVPQYPNGNPTPVPPKIAPGISAQDLVQIGQNIVASRGCMACHSIGGNEKMRCPNLDGVGARAATRYPGYNAEQYILRRLTDPDFSAIEGFPKIMPKVWQPPLSLTWPEVLAATAYLQSLGGNVTVKVTAADLVDGPHTITFPDGAKVTVTKPQPPAKVDPALIQEGHDVMMSLPQGFRCIDCHKIGGEEPPGWSASPDQGPGHCPDLSQIGSMHDATYIEKKVENPNSLPPATGYETHRFMPNNFVSLLQQKYGAQEPEKLAALAAFIASHNGTVTFSHEFSPWIIGAMLLLAVALNFLVGRKA